MFQKSPSWISKSFYRFTARVIPAKFSTIPSVKQNSESAPERNLNDLENLCSVFPKNRVKLPQRHPFAKNLFLGKLDTEILTYPQLPKEDVDELEKVKKYLQTNLADLKEATDFKEVTHILKTYKFLGMQNPIDGGGRELNLSEQCSYNEVILDNKFKYNLLLNELGIIALSKFGTEEQKNKYLQQLLDGTISFTIIMGSSTNSDLFATMSSDLQTFSLNGRKENVVGAKEADLYIIFTKMSDSIKGSLHEMDLTAFILEKDDQGITVEQNQVADCNINGMFNIAFRNVVVSKSNILGAMRDGKNILSVILPEYYLGSSIISLNLIKKQLKYLVEDTLSKSTPMMEIFKTEAVSSRLFEILRDSYTIESMIYLTSGLASMYENQDYELEALITKVLASELALRCTEIGFSLTGAPSLESNHICQQIHKEALTSFNIYEHENMVRIMVGLIGLQYSGKHIGETVKKLRNPLFHGPFILGRLWHERRQYDDNPKLTINVKDYLHLSCQESADLLEYCVHRLRFVTESLFAKHGIDILNKHSQIRRLSDIAIQIYAMTACLGRASRSYCIGLRHAELEVMMASAVCQKGVDVVKQRVNEILYINENTDKTSGFLTEQLFNKKEHYFMNPLTRNF